MIEWNGAEKQKKIKMGRQNTSVGFAWLVLTVRITAIVLSRRGSTRYSGVFRSTSTTRTSTHDQYSSTGSTSVVRVRFYIVVYCSTH